MKSVHTSQTSHEQSWAPAVAFWLCLFVAGLLFAAAYLSPKLLTHARLSSRRFDNHEQLVTLSQHCEHLEVVQQALESDPGMKAELARIEFDAVDPAEQRIAVGAGLTLNAIAAAPIPKPPGTSLAWYAPMLEFLVDNPQYAHCMLLIAAVLVVYGFIGLQPPLSLRERGQG